MKIKLITCLSATFVALCAAQSSFALPQVEDAGDVLSPSNSASGYLSSTPVAAPEMTQSVAPQQTGSINDDLLAKINALEQEVQSLTGQVDELQHSLTQSQKEQAVLMDALNKKVSAMSVPAPVATPSAPSVAKATTNTSASSVKKATPAAVVPVPAKTASVVTPEAQEKATYDAAYSLVSAKAYADAIEAFIGYLSIYTNGKYVSQANYWLGELNASQEQYPTAIKYLEIVVNQYPKSSKVPDAMLKLGIINKRLGNDTKAQAWFARVMKEYPQSSSAQSAKEYTVS